MALADSFFRQPRASDVKDREVTYKRGEFIFKEEYICSRLWMGGFQRGG